MKKYELVLNETKEVDGHTLYRIRALKDFSNVKKGEIGGYIEKEENLSHNGNCWVYDDACVYENAWVRNNAEVRYKAQVFGHALAFGHAEISGQAQISGQARIFGNTLAFDHAEISGNTWIFDHAWISGNAWISGHAHISGNAKISNYAFILYNDHWISMTPVGPENGTLTAYRQKDNSIGVTIGDFSGTLEEFIEYVNQEHGDNKYGKIYRSIILTIKLQLEDITVE